MGPIYSLDDFLDMVWRHLRLIIGLTLLGCIGALLYAENQQHMYRSAEVIQIEAPKIASDLAPSTVAGSSARRLQLIEQQIMARSSLIAVIEKFDLYGDTPGMTLTEKVNRLRGAVSIDGVAAVREGFADDGTISVVTISANMATAQQAQGVAHEMAQRTIALSAKSRAEQTKATLEFFTLQEDKLTKEVTALQDEIADFRAANDLAIPGSLEFRRSEISTINRAILDIERSLITVQRQLDQVDRNGRRSTVERQVEEFESELAGLNKQRDLLRERVAGLTASIDTSPEVERQVSAFERELRQLQGQLDVISTRRTEAEVGARLEARNDAEQLTVLESAPLPEYPYTASKKRRALMGGVASVLGALAVAFVLDLRKPVLRTATQMKRETGLTPVVSIPFLAAKPIRTSRIATLRYHLQEWLEARRRRAIEPPDNA